MMRRLRWVLAVLFAATTLAQREPPMRVRGRVADAAGAPLAGACIGSGDAIVIADVLAGPGVRSGADGGFELELPAPRPGAGRGQELWIAAPGRVGVQVPNLGWHARAANDLPIDLGEIRLPAGATLTGRVRGADGKPVAGARVVALDCLGAWQGGHCHGSAARTGADGVFRLPGVFPQAMSIRIHASGHHDAVLPCSDVGQPLDVRLAASGFVDGVVLGEGGKPADALVTLAYEFAGVPGEVVDAPGGRFRASIAAPCRFVVRAWLRDVARDAISDVLSGPVAGLELRCGDGGFAIRAVDAASGAPVPAIRVAGWWHRHAPDGVEDLLVWQLLPSLANGTVWLRPKPGAIGTVLVAADGYAPALTAGVVAKRGGEHVAKLAPEASVAGTVVDAVTGAPVAGVVVTCERSVRGDRWGPRVAPYSAVTGADGAFAFRGLAPREYVMRAAHPRGGAFAEAQEDLGAGEARTGVRIALPAGVTVSGTVTGGELPPGSSVLLATADRLAVESEQWFGVGPTNDAVRPADAVPLDAGTFRVPNRGRGAHEMFLVVPGAVRQGPALRIPLGPVQLDGDARTLAIDVRSRLPGTVAGKLTIAGEDVSRSRFAVISIAGAGDPPPGSYRPARLACRWTLVAADGTFAVPAVPGKVGIQVVDVATGVVFWRSPEALDVAGGQKVVCDPRVDVVAVDVRFDVGERDRLGAERLVLTRGNDDPHTVTSVLGGGVFGTPGVDLTGVQGERELRCLVPPGTWVLTAAVGAVPGEDGSFSWGSAQPTARETVEATAGEVATVTLRLPEPAPARGR